LKKIIKSVGLITLISFSFFYTDRVIDVINEQDPIMIKISDMKDYYKQEAIDAIIDDDTIIPGLYGYEVDVDSSYDMMRSVGIYNDTLYHYKDIKPTISISDNMDKYIIRGNPNKFSVAIIFILTGNLNLDEIIKITMQKQTPINFFIDFTYLNKNINKIKEVKNGSFYTYGDNGVYAPDILLFSNNLLENIGNNKASYCLSDTKNNKTLQLCKNYNMYTIIPNITGGYNDIKNNLKSGSIILLESSYKNISELNNIINFINNKGYNIVSLDNLLSEK